MADKISRRGDPQWLAEYLEYFKTELVGLPEDVRTLVHIIFRRDSEFHVSIGAASAPSVGYVLTVRQGAPVAAKATRVLSLLREPNATENRWLIQADGESVIGVTTLDDAKRSFATLGEDMLRGVVLAGAQSGVAGRAWGWWTGTRLVRTWTWLSACTGFAIGVGGLVAVALLMPSRAVTSSTSQGPLARASSGMSLKDTVDQMNALIAKQQAGAPGGAVGATSSASVAPALGPDPDGTYGSIPKSGMEAFVKMAEEGGIAPPAGQVKHARRTIYVMTDPLCPKCKELNSDVDALLASGVKVVMMPVATREGSLATGTGVLCRGAESRWRGWIGTAAGGASCTAEALKSADEAVRGNTHALVKLSEVLIYPRLSADDHKPFTPTIIADDGRVRVGYSRGGVYELSAWAKKAL